MGSSYLEKLKLFWSDKDKMFKCRSPMKIMGLSVDEMARRKLEYHNWRTERDRDNNEKHLNNINMERFHKNRVRRLLKEQEEKQKKDVHEKKKNDISLQSDSKCSKCHKNHLHKERGSTSQNKDLQYCSKCFGPSKCKLQFTETVKNGIAATSSNLFKH